MSRHRESREFSCSTPPHYHTWTQEPNHTWQPWQPWKPGSQLLTSSLAVLTNTVSIKTSLATPALSTAQPSPPSPPASSTPASRLCSEDCDSPTLAPNTTPVDNTSANQGSSLFSLATTAPDTALHSDTISPYPLPTVDSQPSSTTLHPLIAQSTSSGADPGPTLRSTSPQTNFPIATSTLSTQTSPQRQSSEFQSIYPTQAAPTPRESGGGQSGGGVPHTFLSGLSTNAKVGSIIGFVFLVLAIILSAVLYFRRNKRCSRLHPAQFPFLGRDENRSSHSISASYFPVPSRLEERGDMQPLMIYAGEPRESLSVDDAGVKWPEMVVLRGDAKDFYDATEMYKQEYRERKKGSEERRDEERKYYIGRWRL